MDERKEFEAWARTQADSWLIVGGLTWSPGTGDYASARTNAAWASWQARAALAAQPAASAEPSDDVAELISLLRAIRPKYGYVGTRDVDVAAQQHRIDRAIALLSRYGRSAGDAEPVATIHVDGSFVHVEWKETPPEIGSIDVYSGPVAAQDSQAVAWLRNERGEHSGPATLDPLVLLTEPPKGAYRATYTPLYAAPVAAQKADDGDTLRTAVMDAIAEALGDAYDCTRVWSAWSYGTMGPDDFALIADDADRLGELADAAIAAMQQSQENGND